MIQESKGVKTVSFMQIEAEDSQIVFGLPPYMTPKQYALLVGKTERAIKKDLQDGDIARYQPVKGGLVYVNVIKEIQKAEQAPDY